MPKQIEIKKKKKKKAKTTTKSILKKRRVILKAIKHLKKQSYKFSYK
jgi:hypothetical protein